jgi:hypothetical protein
LPKNGVAPYEFAETSRAAHFHRLDLCGRMKQQLWSSDDGDLVGAMKRAATHSAF